MFPHIAQPLLPSSHQPKLKQWSIKIQVNPRQVHEQMGHPVECGENVLILLKSPFFLANAGANHRRRLLRARRVPGPLAGLRLGGQRRRLPHHLRQHSAMRLVHLPPLRRPLRPLRPLPDHRHRILLLVCNRYVSVSGDPSG